MDAVTIALSRRAVVGSGLMLAFFVTIPAAAADTGSPSVPVVVRITLDQALALDKARAQVARLTDAVIAAIGPTAPRHAIWVHVYGAPVIGRGVVGAGRAAVPEKSRAPVRRADCE